MASATPIAALNHRFEIPGIAKLVEGRGGMPAVRINSPEVSGEIYLHGAHVTSWKPEGAEEVLFEVSFDGTCDGATGAVVGANSLLVRAASVSWLARCRSASRPIGADWPSVETMGCACPPWSSCPFCETSRAIPA